MLSSKDIRVLEFENSWWHYPEPKDRAIREYVGMSSTRYYQVLRRLLEDPEALRYDPLTVKRLQKVRVDASRRAAQRSLGNGDGTEG